MTASAALRDILGSCSETSGARQGRCSGLFGDAGFVLSRRSRRRHGCHGRRPGELLGHFRGSAVFLGPRPFEFAIAKTAQIPPLLC